MDVRRFVCLFFSRSSMATEMNETFMVRTSTPEMTNEENEITTEKLQTKLTQVQLKTTLSDVQKSPNQRHQSPPMDLLILPKTQADIVVRSLSSSFLVSNSFSLVSQCHRSECWWLSLHNQFIHVKKIRRFNVSRDVQWTIRSSQR